MYCCYEWKTDNFSWGTLWDIHMGNYSDSVLRKRQMKYFYTSICQTVTHTIIFNYENLQRGNSWSLYQAIYPLIGLFNLMRSLGSYAGAT